MNVFQIIENLFTYEILIYIGIAIVCFILIVIYLYIRGLEVIDEIELE